MGDLTGRGFGLVIAYLVPGFVLLLGAAEVSPDVRAWVRTSADAGSPTVGSFLYVLLASLAGGMALGAFRWALVDTLHHRTGVPRPRLDVRRLHERLAAFDAIVDYHYRYYEFFAHTLLANLAGYACWRVAAATSAGSPRPADAAFLVLELVFFAASRDTLRNYYGRAGQLLGTAEGEVTMTNGAGHHEQAPAVTSPRRPERKPGVAPGEKPEPQAAAAKPPRRAPDTKG